MNKHAYTFKWRCVYIYVYNYTYTYIYIYSTYGHIILYCITSWDWTYNKSVTQTLNGSWPPRFNPRLPEDFWDEFPGGLMFGRLIRYQIWSGFTICDVEHLLLFYSIKRWKGNLTFIFNPKNKHMGKTMGFRPIHLFIWHFRTFLMVSSGTWRTCVSAWRSSNNAMCQRGRTAQMAAPQPTMGLENHQETIVFPTKYRGVLQIFP